MTCNNLEIIPPELYRAGRIDLTKELKGLTITHAKAFIKKLLKSFKLSKAENLTITDKILLSLPKTGVVTQAEIQQTAITQLQQSQYGIGN